jgi:hypothetical protein
VSKSDAHKLAEVYVEQFLNYGDTILSDLKTPPHTLKISDDKTSAVLDFPPQDADGFAVVLTADHHGIVVHAGKLSHTHFDEGADVRQNVERAFGYARDLLSPKMRLLERRAGGRPYWSGTQIFDGHDWQSEQTTGLFIWSFFGKRTSHIMMNRQLPARDS